MIKGSERCGCTIGEEHGPRCRFRENACRAASCNKDVTHYLHIRVVATDDFDEMTTDTGYCLDDCLYFAAWLPYCYPGEYELIGITPPASELFDRS